MVPPTDLTVPLPPSGTGGDARRLRLSLLGAFELLDNGHAVVLSGGAQRLLAFVALQRYPVSRDAVAEASWSDVSEAQSEARLLSSIGELEQLAPAPIIITGLKLELSPKCWVDVVDAEALAQRICIVDTMPSEGDMTLAAIETLSSELLPDWYDDWLVFRAQDWRQIRLHALETLSQKLLDAARFTEALASASAVQREDPLRESPHALTILVHLAEGNQSEAVRVFRNYCLALQEELGVEPTPQLRALLTGQIS